jgi:glycosyltransferase involved in cell wall biosynthesis
LLARDAAKAQRLERAAARAYHGLVLVGAEDAATLGGGAIDRSRAVIVPNGVDTTALVPTPLPAAPRLLLPASLNYRPNVLGAVWFCETVLPLVREQVPGTTLDLVGRHPVDEVLALRVHAGVEVHGDVPRMAPWFDRARVVVVPVRVGTGTRLKALEAMAAGRPVVGTTIGLEGLRITDGVHACVTDEPRAMADAIVRALTSDEHALALAEGGRRHVEALFSWGPFAQRLGDALTGSTR